VWVRRRLRLYFCDAVDDGGSSVWSYTPFNQSIIDEAFHASVSRLVNVNYAII